MEPAYRIYDNNDQLQYSENSNKNSILKNIWQSRLKIFIKIDYNLLWFTNTLSYLSEF